MKMRIEGKVCELGGFGIIYIDSVRGLGSKGSDDDDMTRRVIYIYKNTDQRPAETRAKSIE